MFICQQLVQMATGPNANAQLQAILTALNNVIASAHVTTFALIAGQHSVNQIIDYSTKEGCILEKKEEITLK